MAQPLKIRQHTVDLLFVLALFCVFAASALLVVLIGANVYRSTVRSMDRNFNLQTTLSYVAAKVQQNDRAGAVSVVEFEGTPALRLTETIDGQAYETMVYAYEGTLRELFTRRGSGAGPAEGTVLTEISDFTVEEAGDGLFRFTCAVQGGAPAELTVGVQCDRAPEGLVTLP